MKRGLVFGAILVAALAAFEIFNFSTTEFALRDFLGDERFLGLYWATILAVAFCGIDFAGLARLFTPDGAAGDSRRLSLANRAVDHADEVWYLLGAWFLGATLNAMATWWAVTLTLLDHEIGNEVLSREQVLTYVPIFVAALVWLTRILIISTFSVAGERLFAQAERALREAGQNLAPAPTDSPLSRWAVPTGEGQGVRAAPARIIGESDRAGAPVSSSAQRPPQAARPNAAYTRPAPKPPQVPQGSGGPQADHREPLRYVPADEPGPARRPPANGANLSNQLE